MELSWLLIGVAIGLLVGALAAALLRRNREQASTLAAANERAALQAEIAAADATSDGLREQLEQVQAKNVELLEQERRDAKVLQALAPVLENLAQMRQKIAELEQQRQKQHGELAEQLRGVAHDSEQLRGVTGTLATALKSNSTRGVWGETQLRSVVEAAGLLERVDFIEQHTIAGDSSAGRPDMIVRLPGGKALAVDAKAPFSAFLEASAIPPQSEGEEGARRTKLLAQHVKAVRNHVNTLSTKSYWEGLDEVSPEFVIAFIPSESLVSAAMAADPSLMEYAFSRRVALASPVTLWSVLKTVAFTWRQEVVTDEARELLQLSHELYRRLATMTAHISKLGRALNSGVSAYNAFIGSLERQVLVTARKLADLDESKMIENPEALELEPRQVSAPEITATDD